MDTGDVEDVGVGDDIGDVMGFAGVEFNIDDFVHDFEGEAENFRGDEAEADVVLGEEAGKGVDGTTEAEVTDHGDFEAVDLAEFLANGEEVEEGLGGMFASAITGVDDRHAGVVGGDFGRADFGVAEYDGIGILFESTDGVGEGFPFADGAEFDTGGDGDDATAKPFHGGDEGGAGAGTGFVEEAGEDVAAEEVGATTMLDHGTHFAGTLKDVFDDVTVELGDGEDVLVKKAVILPFDGGHFV